jgi:hypothetical protein
VYEQFGFLVMSSAAAACVVLAQLMLLAARPRSGEGPGSSILA